MENLLIISEKTWIDSNLFPIESWWWYEKPLGQITISMGCTTSLTKMLRTSGFI